MWKVGGCTSVSERAASLRSKPSEGSVKAALQAGTSSSLDGARLAHTHRDQVKELVGQPLPRAGVNVSLVQVCAQHPHTFGARQCGGRGANGCVWGVQESRGGPPAQPLCRRRRRTAVDVEADTAGRHHALALHVKGRHIADHKAWAWVGCVRQRNSLFTQRPLGGLPG